MGPRTRRALAAVGVLVFLAFYVWAVIGIGGLLPQHWLAQGLFYGIAGIAWGVPILPLLNWAERPPRPRPPADDQS